jgi:hypothetical protein
VELELDVLTRWEFCFCTTIHILVIFPAWRWGQATEQDSQCVAVVAGMPALARKMSVLGRWVGYPRAGIRGKLRSRRHDLTWLQRLSFGQQRNISLWRLVLGSSRAQTSTCTHYSAPWLDTYLLTLGS